tara:strand:+ start:16698 stop:17399 length:702 start_codon:yes stop_codon:yes gene_type:complete
MNKKRITKILMAMACLSLLNMAPMAAAPAPPAPLPLMELIKQATKKVIKAMDLMVQRLQNKTIWLQNAQKAIENTLSKLRLDEISEWTQRQKELYEGYYTELANVKSVISYYGRIRDITEMQKAMVGEYGRVWNLLRQDTRFTPDELDFMADVYSGMMEGSLENLDRIFLVLEAFATEMGDAQRLAIINEAADRVEESYMDLKRFNAQNIISSMRRAKSESELAAVRHLYGIE